VATPPTTVGKEVIYEELISRDDKSKEEQGGEERKARGSSWPEKGKIFPRREETISKDLKKDIKRDGMPKTNITREKREGELNSRTNSFHIGSSS